LYYCKFANIAYGWKLVEAIINKKATTVIAGFTKKALPGNAAEISHNVLCYTKYIGLPPESIIHAEWFSNYMSPAHLVCVSHEKRKIIVTIRGTMDLHDCLADVICNYESVIENDITIKYHKGMNKCALTKLLIVEAHVMQALQQYPDYGIVFTGHSLGAGTAGIVALHFKKKNPQLNIKAWLYGCPPVLDKDNVYRTHDFITSVINRDDIIPRLTYGSLYDLKAMIKYVLKENPTMSKRVWQVVSAGGNMPKAVSTRVTNSVGQTGINIEKLKELKTQEKLYVPGRIVFMFTPPEKTNRYWYAEIDDNMVFDEIVLSTHMYRDHMPNNYERNLKKAYKTHIEEFAKRSDISLPVSDCSEHNMTNPDRDISLLGNIVEMATLVPSGIGAVVAQGEIGSAMKDGELGKDVHNNNNPGGDVSLLGDVVQMTTVPPSDQC